MKNSFKTTFFDNQTQSILTGFCLIVALSIFVGIAKEWYFLAGIPLALLVVYVGILDFKKLFFLLMASIPLATEVSIAGNLTLDLPDEPLMMGLTGIYFLYILKPGRQLQDNFLRHPITILLIIHLAWIFITAITSQTHFVSFKFFAAKIWYVVTFYFFAGIVLQKKKDWKTMFWCILIPLILTVMFVLTKHGIEGFSLKGINKAVRPFYRNHVSYACLMVLFMPFMWYALDWYERYSKRWWAIIFGIAILFLGIQFSYTRAAYVALFGAIGAFYIIKFRLVKYVLAVGAIAAILAVVHFTHNNKYLDYAPDFDKTITHENFGNLLEATTKGQDVSTMERVYRWVAGMHMVEERPWLGYGPGNFARYYKEYTVPNFRTYVSDNEDDSGVHNYFFTVAVEQGLLGMIIFTLLTFLVLLKGEQIFHQTKEQFHKNMIMTVLLTYIIILMLLLMNDMIETDKVGSFFFICMAVVVNVDLRNRRLLKEK